MCLSVLKPDRSNLESEGVHGGLEFAVTTSGLGSRCGYVRVPPGHPCHGMDYDSVVVDVHGGLTFGSADVDCDADGADGSWWFGFDCCHNHDLSDDALLDEMHRGLEARYPGLKNPWATVKDNAHVVRECESLASQLAAMT